MQLAHHRRPRPFRGSTKDRSRGAVLVEAAFVTPIFLMLVFGIMEVGLAMNDNLALAHTVRAGSRVASASGNDLYADYGIIRAIARESTALPRDQIKMIVVYRANAHGEAPSPSCQLGTPEGSTVTTSRPCNVYYPSDFDKPKEEWGCKPPPERIETWCPTSRKVTLAGSGTEFIGVWMKVEHAWVTRMFGSTITLTDLSVIRLEPRSRT